MMKVPKQILVEPGWHQGGTLLDATIGEWHQASWRNGLATCSLWVRAAAQLHGQYSLDDTGAPIGYYVSDIDFAIKADLLDYSVGLLRALAEGTSRRLDDENVRELKIGIIVQATLRDLGWQSLKDMTVPRSLFGLPETLPQEAPKV